MAQKKPETQPRRRMRGFEAAAQLVAQRVKAVGESRGFATARLLTHWSEVVGPELAARTRPVRISHGKGLGATLTLLVPGAQAPLIGMQLDQIRERVNACYGFNAVSRIVLTQTAPTGFAEGQAEFIAAPPRTPPPPDPQKIAQADDIASGFDHPALSAAMRRLALNILSRRDTNDRKANP
ncbi:MULTISPECIES: DUF721 domain-containing protein [Paracoccus]|jgi:hypothetical protein|uniref:DUF721 domain-containing protein n=1 Tax=Paracoccus TaxID=265 RepID=UPI000CEC2893|nr:MULTISPECIES: DUF721 domain-containing protein [Paracoccus]MDK8874552.1 DUF721 domain-containing protein [Paracoccus sp. SSJ]UFS65403.1 DUF721 domain-containing protein [Paracoccus denitrificans]